MADTPLNPSIDLGLILAVGVNFTHFSGYYK